MFHLSAPDINIAYVKGLSHLLAYGEWEDSRAGRVLTLPYPVVIEYTHPTRRVLFDKQRNANPFFHLMESLWMLNGLNSGEWLDTFVSDFSCRFGETGGIIHGAYGHRWRVAFGFDQIQAIIRRLNAYPNDRQAVLSMWDAHWDRSNDLMGGWKDRPCNLSVAFRRRGDSLDITVFCRSNDAVWGAFGANAVHFSILQEYVASALAIKVGTYYQVSNNFHAYKDTLIKHKIYDPETGFDPRFSLENAKMMTFAYPVRIPLIGRHAGDFLTWNVDLGLFFQRTLKENDFSTLNVSEFISPWFRFTVIPLWNAFYLWKKGDKDGALHTLRMFSEGMAPDWKLAAEEWMERGIARRGVNRV